MPRGPKGEKRPADVIGNAVHVMRIATGEIEDTVPYPRERGQRPRRRGAWPEGRECTGGRNVGQKAARDREEGG
jgi:hypothetical protein